ncbi:MAG: nicotinate phosphoribosyltransferase [Clostridium butyricum]
MRNRCINPILLTDFYKTIHHKCYAPNMTKLVSYWTPRKSRLEGVNEVVMFGLQYVIQKYLIDTFNEDFFDEPKEVIINNYKEIIAATMGEENADTEHIEKLHDLGYLPIEIKALPEGTLAPIKVPMFEITNTHPDFAWLVNYLETLISSNIWFPMTSATIGHEFRKIVNLYYKVSVDGGLPQKACGNFDMRGMTSTESAIVNGACHLLSFSSTATIPSIPFLQHYYNGDLKEIGRGTPSLEHSVVCSYGDSLEQEFECYRHIIEDVYPNGVISMVSDSYDYWNVLTDMLPRLKSSILSRDGKIVIRPDSGVPADIICGTKTVYDLDLQNKEEYKLYFADKTYNKWKNGKIDYDDSQDYYYEANDKVYKLTNFVPKYVSTGGYNIVDEIFSDCTLIEEYTKEFTVEEKGSIEVLGEVFGYTINSKGYKVLNPKIGLIYGDGITLERCQDICKRLLVQGWATNNVIFGVGSYSYQYATRDTLGFALKATHSIVDGKERKIQKHPKTDNDSFKKSQKGMCVVYKDNSNKIKFIDGLTIQQQKNCEDENLLKPVFKNGKMLVQQDLRDIRDRLNKDNF